MKDLISLAMLIAAISYLHVKKFQRESEKASILANAAKHQPPASTSFAVPVRYVESK
jgi:hypothetical protein